jgi:two-component system response regulator MprA
MRILVVDDEPAVRDSLERALRLDGYEVDLARDGREGLERCRAAPPDAIVLDLHLPGIHGEAILGEVVARPDLSHIPVIVVTGSDTHNVVAQAKAILRKPVDVTRLVSVVERHLESAA